MMTIMESTITVGFRTASTSGYRSCWISDDATSVNFTSRCPVFFPRLIDSCSLTTRSKSNPFKSRIRAATGFSSSAADPPRLKGKPSYHPFEEVGESTLQDNEDARLTAAETSRTVIEVYSTATLMFSGLMDDQLDENIFCQDLPYITDEHGNIHFEMKTDEDILRSLTTDNNYVQVIIGLDTNEMLREIELGPSDIDFGIEEIADEDIDGEDDEDWVAILEDEVDELNSDDTLGDWAKLETMHSSHPMSFAKKISEVTSDDPMGWMDQPSAGLAIQGILRPAFIEEHSVTRKHISDHQSSRDDTNQVGKIMGDDLEDYGINGHDPKSDFKASSKDGSIWAEELEKCESLRTVTSFYKLEIIKIQLISGHGSQTVVEVNDFQKARPDTIAHAAAKIISRMRAGGEKTTQALKTLCCRVKGIQVEEARLIGVDCLGFDVRVSSGTQVQTLRFAFNTKATSEYSAERQLYDLMTPRIHHKLPNQEEIHQKYG